LETEMTVYEEEQGQMLHHWSEFSRRARTASSMCNSW
jgi:hypothetical protein